MRKKMTVRMTFLACIVSASFIQPNFVRAMDPPEGGSTPAANVNLRAADDSENVRFVLTLNLRNQDQLKRELKDIYDRASPHYHQFLSASDFISKYAPSKDDYAALKAFAAKHGLKITGEHAGRTMLNVQGSTASIRDLFKSQMYWRQTKEGKPYLASDIEPMAPSDLSSLGGNAAGLNQKPLKAFATRAQAVAGNSSSSGSGYKGSWEPKDIKTAYDLNSIQNGGQAVAVAEFSSANYSDAAYYASAFGLNSPNLTQVAVDGGTSDASDAPEVMLDIEMVTAVSNASNIYVYTAPNNNASSLDLYTQIADDDLVGQVSISWGQCEADLGQASATQENAAFSQMAAEGIAVFAASGDDGAYGCGTNFGAPTPLGVNDPASQPYVTGVGGTSLTTTAAQAYESENVWLILPSANTGWQGSGGGISIFWPIPQYQTTVTPQPTTGDSNNTIQFSTTMRNVPDVAFFADPSPGYYIYCSACGEDGAYGWGEWGGTSAAAPQWAAVWGLIGQGLSTTLGVPARAGFANPTLYTIGENASQYSQAFHDVINGGNGYYLAAPGYDDTTGWGSYDGAGLYRAVIAQDTKKSPAIVPVINFILKTGM